MLFSRAFMIRRRGIYLWVVAVFVASELLAWALGVRFADETLGRLYQYLDVEILRHDLVNGLFYLHAQPPLFNLFLGVVLKLFPESYGAIFSSLFALMGLSVLAGMAWILRRLDVPDAVNAVVVLLFALSPNFLAYRSWLFYTLPVAFLLVASVVCLDRYLHRSHRGALHAFLAVGAILMLTRALYHPLWLVVVVAAVTVFVSPGRRRTLVLASLVPLLVVNLWFLKNRVIVGSFAGSTWLGMSLAKRWPLSQREMAELKRRGLLPPFWHRRPFAEPEELRPFGFFERTGDTHPALDAPYKTNGEPNFNHRDYVTISNAMLDGNLYLIRDYPERYLRRVATAFLLYLQPGPNSVHFLVDYDFDRVHAYREWVTRYLFLGGRIKRPIRMLEPPPNLWLVLFPLALAIGAHGASRGDPKRRALFAHMLVCVLWVTAVANLVEIGENDRMRWEVEPFLAIFLAYGVSALWRRLRPTSSAAETA